MGKYFGLYAFLLAPIVSDNIFPLAPSTAGAFISFAAATGYLSCLLHAHGRAGICAGHEINKAQRGFDACSVDNAFWTDLLPPLYGNLLEMYGDAKGRARMGLGDNDALTGSWLQILRKDSDLYGVDDMRRWVNALTPQQKKEAFGVVGLSLVGVCPNDKALLKVLLKGLREDECLDECGSKPDVPLKGPSQGEVAALKI